MYNGFCKNSEMKSTLIVYCLTVLSSVRIFGQQMSPEYPILKHYDQDHLSKIAMPIGGIRTGSISYQGGEAIFACGK